VQLCCGFSEKNLSYIITTVEVDNLGLTLALFLSVILSVHCKLARERKRKRKVLRLLSATVSDLFQFDVYRDEYRLSLRRIRFACNRRMA